MTALVLVGCAVPPPFAALETAGTLPARAIGVEGGAGGGVGDDNGPATLGAFGRLRYGLGDHQELGLEAAGLFDAQGNAASGKLVYKRAPWQHVALEAGLGGTVASESTLGADVATIVSGDDGDGLVPYGAVRISAAVPASLSFADARVASEVLTIPIGVVQRLSRHLRGFAEIGGLVTVTEGSNVATGHGFGIYGAIAVGWQQ